MGDEVQGLHFSSVRTDSIACAHFYAVNGIHQGLLMRENARTSLTLSMQETLV